jgi:glycosyltransferase involved in cell wall biosynthesis
VVTIHDVISLEYPNLCRFTNVLYYKKFLPHSILTSTKIIVPSLYTKKRILHLSNVSSHKIHVIPEGIQDIFLNDVDDTIKDDIRRKYNLPDKFLLYVGNIEPKKNLDLVVDVFQKLQQILPEIKLVIIGKFGWKSKNIKRKILRLQSEKKLIATGYMPINDLAVTYKLAELFVFPSLVEGFGIPPLEAMASGTPVITSNRAAIPEVVGTAAIKIDPTNADQFFRAIIKVLTSKNLKQELIEKGFERIKKFSWKKAAEKTLEVYKSV